MQPTPALVKDYHNKLLKLNNTLRAEGNHAQAIYPEQADRHHITPPVYYMGDEVLLLR